jgi:uncharacterized membrane protein YcaP (DUF421 family)
LPADIHPAHTWKGGRGILLSPATIETAGQLSVLTTDRDRERNLEIRVKASRFPNQIMSKMKMMIKTKTNPSGTSSDTFYPVPLP